MFLESFMRDDTERRISPGGRYSFIILYIYIFPLFIEIFFVNRVCLQLIVEIRIYASFLSNTKKPKYILCTLDRKSDELISQLDNRLFLMRFAFIVWRRAKIDIAVWERRRMTFYFRIELVNIFFAYFFKLHNSVNDSSCGITLANR